MQIYVMVKCFVIPIASREFKGFLKLEPACLVHNSPFKSKELQKIISSEAILAQMQGDT